MLGGSFWIALLRNAISTGLMLSFFHVGPAEVFHEENSLVLHYIWRFYGYCL